MLVEIAEAPAERRFLADLSQALRTKDEILYIEKDAKCRLSRNIDGKAHKIGICLKETTRRLFADLNGTLYIYWMPSQRIFTHALIVIYNRVIKTFDLEAFPKTLRWGSGDAMMSICGRGKTTTGQTKVAQYCENAFAQKRGKIARVSSTLPVYFTKHELSKAKLLQLALANGASGTVQQLMHERRLNKFEILFNDLVQAFTIRTGYETSNEAEDAELYKQILKGRAEALEWIFKEGRLAARALFCNKMLLDQTHMDTR